LIKEKNDEPYDPKQDDPNKVNALSSSLWELFSLQNHFSPAVSQLVQVVERNLKTNQKTPFKIKDFVDVSYQTQISEQMNYRKNKQPALNYQVVPSLFPDTSGQMGPWVF